MEKAHCCVMEEGVSSTAYRRRELVGAPSESGGSWKEGRIEGKRGLVKSLDESRILTAYASRADHFL